MVIDRVFVRHCLNVNPLRLPLLPASPPRPSTVQGYLALVEENDIPPTSWFFRSHLFEPYEGMRADFFLCKEPPECGFWTPEMGQFMMALDSEAMAHYIHESYFQDVLGTCMETSISARIMLATCVEIQGRLSTWALMEGTPEVSALCVSLFHERGEPSLEELLALEAQGVL